MIFLIPQACAQFLVIRLIPSLAGNLLKAVATVGGLSLLKLYVLSPFFPVWGSLTPGHISSRVLDSVRVHYVYCSLLCNCGNIFSCFWIQNLPGLCHALCFWSICNLLRYFLHLEPSSIICCCCLCSYCTWLGHVFEAESCVVT